MTPPHRLALEHALYRLSKRWWRLTGRLPDGVRTALMVADRPVFLVHNPKCAGSSLKRLLGVQAPRTTHSWPSDLFRPKLWETGIFVVAVRHPMDRFLSSWRYHCRSGYRGKLVKRHGDLSHLTPLEYFSFIRQYPENCGLQSLWVDYPSARKPHCDIVLKVEDSAQWPQTLRDHGIVPQMADMPVLNASPASGAGNRPDLGLTEAEFLTLRQQVETFYHSDYLRFGYDFGAGGEPARNPSSAASVLPTAPE
jgi:Sulfotransferase family